MHVTLIEIPVEAGGWLSKLHLGRQRSKVHQSSSEYGLAIERILRRGSASQTLYVSVGEADLFVPWIIRLAEGRAQNNQPPLLGRIVVKK